VVGGETMKSEFERASEVPFEIPGSLLSNPEHTITTTDADFMDRLWLLGITLVLIMASGERLLWDACSEQKLKMETRKITNAHIGEKVT
jgi:hypothetical protein